VTEYDAVVYDLDGTLIELAVDWAAVDREVGECLTERAGVEIGEEDAWGLLDVADDVGERAAVERIIAEHEHRGAEQSELLELAEEIRDATHQVAVCSLNCEMAVRRALAEHGLDAHVESVVGRDSVSTRKPDPGPLLAALDSIGVPPERALFVGDSESDAVAARAAGIDFAYVSDRLNRA
jgi:phosphoglycolate phosphatase